MRMHGSEYGVDTSAIAIGGCSAGGQLAALVGATNGIVRFEGEGGNRAQSSAVQAVVDIDGILDFSDPAESGKDTIPGKPSAGTLWFGGTFREKPETWLDASPLTHAGPKTPPILFVNSALERFHAGRDSMISILSRSGTWTVVRTLPKTPHPFWLFHPWFEPACDAVVAFLDRVFPRQRR
jgi:pectinesterase